MDRFEMDGSVAGRTVLTGVAEAAGVALLADKLYVLDGADQEVRVFDRDVVVTGID